MREKIKNLVTAIAENDDELAFKQLFMLFFPGLFSFANSIIYDRQSAEEVVDDVFVKIWNNRKLLITINDLSYYLYTATKFTAINYIKRNRRRSLVSLHDTDGDFIVSINDPHRIVIHKENVKKIESAINALPAKCRLIFKLIKEDKMKYKEVSKLLDLSVKTVEAHMALAYSRIVENLETELPEYAVLIKAKNGRE